LEKRNFLKILVLMLLINIIIFSCLLYIMNEQKNENKMAANNYLQKVDDCYVILGKISTDDSVNKDLYLRLLMVFKELDTMAQYTDLDHSNYFSTKALLVEDMLKTNSLNNKDSNEITHIQNDFKALLNESSKIDRENIDSLNDVILSTLTIN